MKKNQSFQQQNSIKCNPRIGHGYDSHRLTSGNQIMIGGVKIPHDKTVIAHSDGDVVIHAICDAILGAAALGNIGQHFPDTDPKFKNINSSSLLEQVLQLIKEKNLIIGNIDVTVILERPKLLSYIHLMQMHLAHIMQLDISQISIKAKTNEKMGYIGREEGIAAESVVLLFPI